MPKKKRFATIKIEERKVWADQTWTVDQGKLKASPGNPGSPSLFSVIAEKLPFDALQTIRNYMKEYDLDNANGIYIAHDSMGCPRYIGRGDIFSRLLSRKKKSKLELQYFSFYVIKSKKHEREIETLLIRSASQLLFFNSRKKRVDIRAGNIRDYEAGTYFFRRLYKKGKRAKRIVA